MFLPSSEYPRPDFDRSQQWLNLNGEWDFSADPDNIGLLEQWQRASRDRDQAKICVPFTWETEASGIEQRWLPVGWYRRTISVPAEWHGQRTILHIGAAHYHCTAWCNGEKLGEHEGGYLPFSFDLTDHLMDSHGDIVLRVEAPIDKRYIPHGKQRSRPVDDYDGCAFTASSGIWQTVWLEPRPVTHIENIALLPLDELDGFSVIVDVAGSTNGQLSLALSDGDKQIIELDGRAKIETTLRCSKPTLWSPSNPHLYQLTAGLTSDDGNDRVTTFGGLRKIAIDGDRFLLNGQPLYLRGALDQGYWPGSGYTPPDDGALRRDIEIAFAAGFNMVRKHIKFEDPRWLHWADKLGMLVWAEPPSTGRFSQAAATKFEALLEPMVARDGNHPAIIMWGLYNEEWGLDWRSAEDLERQDAVIRAYDKLSALDGNRPIVDDSGWWHIKTDVLDWHYYDMDMSSWQKTTAALAADRDAWFGHQIGETEWYMTQLIVPNRQLGQMPIINSEYGGGPPNLQGWLFRWQTQDLRRHDAFSGYVYTELYDVEHEIVGLFDADRQLKKLGCNPADLNGETVVCFDITPIKPGLDYLAVDGRVQIAARLSHHGENPFAGSLRWGWQVDVGVDSAEIHAIPLQISAPVQIELCMPAGKKTARLFVSVDTQSGETLSTNFVDIMNPTG